MWKDTTEPTIELICLHSAAWAVALIYRKGPMTAAAQSGYSEGKVPGWLHTMYHAGVYSLYSKCYTLQHCHWTLKHGFTNICNRDMHMHALILTRFCKHQNRWHTQAIPQQRVQSVEAWARRREHCCLLMIEKVCIYLSVYQHLPVLLKYIGYIQLVQWTVGPILHVCYN